MTDASLLRLADDVQAAALVVAPSWPLSSVIAVNPLAGFEDLPFGQALDRAEALFGARGHLTLGELRAELQRGRISERALRDALQCAVPAADLAATVRVAGETIPAIEVLVADLVAGADDPDPRRSARTVVDQLDEREGTRTREELDLIATEHCLQSARLDDDPLATLRTALDELRVPPYGQRAYLEAHLAALPGWAAHLRWVAEHGDPDALVAYLAVRVRAEAALVDGQDWFHADGPPARPAATPLRERAAAVALAMGAAADDHDAIATALSALPGPARALVWLDAYERCVHDPLLAAIEAAPLDPPAATSDEAIVAHVVTCIDVRSEGLRRALERQGAYRTYGYAGFFGLFAHLDPITGGTGTDACPVLVTPAQTLVEVPDEGDEETARRAVERRRMAAGADDAWRAAKHHPIAPLALAEGAGWVAGPLAAARTAAPNLSARLADALVGARRRGVHHDRSALSIDEQAGLVRAIWNLGMAQDRASLVVLCGHGSRSDNNPMESALACGACGGNPGGPNARIVAAMANDPQVRAHLAAEGTEIDPATWFVAAEHDTATDRVVVLDPELVPATHLDALRTLEGDLAQAGERAALDRADSLPGAPAPTRRQALRAVRGRGRDWAEPVPELGLAGNAAFIVGPRSLTDHLDLRRRTFLHSYEPSLDPTGATLGGILTAPLVVAQWISAQYYFSTTDPEIFGSGSKAVHNVVGDIGVLSGPGGDLRRGLALQSVRAGDRLLHEPVRLLAIVQGQREHIDAAIAGSTTLQQLVGNGWISLVARHDPEDPWRQRTSEGWALRSLESTGKVSWQGGIGSEALWPAGR